MAIHRHPERPFMPHQEETIDFRALVECSSDAIIVHDLEGNILYANPAAIALARETDPEDALKRKVFDHLPHGIAEMGRKAILKLLDGEEVPPAVTPLTLANGDDIEVEVHLTLITLGHRRVIRVYMRDMTLQKSVKDILTEKVETERALINSPADYAFLIDLHGTILNINDNFARMLGGTYQDFIGASIWDKTPLEGLSEHREEIERVIQSKEALRYEEGRDNRWYDVCINPIQSAQGNVVRLAITGRDITDRKRSERQLEESIAQLKKSNEDLELFAHVAAHDLQEPIRTIVAYSQMLLAEQADGISPQAEKYLRNIEHAGLRMHHLVSDLRKYSDVRARERSREQADLEGVLEFALKNLQIAIHETGASITHDRLPTIPVNRTQIVQVFQNLIENAIKFRKKEVPPVIHISAVPGDGMWQFAVEDNGIGIQHQYYEKIFVLFERLNHRDDYFGTGLGLALCTRIIERHGGRIWVESEIGRGSTFYFTLPGG